MESKEPQVVEPVVEVVVVEQTPTVNDSSEGLARMIRDLNPLANRLRSSCFTLLLFSLLFMGSLEGMFGLIASVGVLCCAAPGSLGVAYAARCTKICATICATLSLMHILCLSTFSVMVMPEMPEAFAHACREAKMHAAPDDAKATLATLLATVVPADSDDAPLAALPPSTSATPTAHIVATVTTAAARRLQEYGVLTAHTDAPCARAERAFAQAAPSLLMAAILVEMCLFVSAMSTAKAAGRLLAAARAYGANAV